MWFWFHGKDTRRELWNLPLYLRNAAEAEHVSGNALHGGLEETLCKALKAIHGLLQRPHDVGEARAVDYLPRKAAECLGIRARERSVLRLTQLKGVGDRKTVLISDMETERLKFVSLVFRLISVQHFLIMPPLLPFRIVMYVLFYCILEILPPVYKFLVEITYPLRAQGRLCTSALYIVNLMHIRTSFSVLDSYELVQLIYLPIVTHPDFYFSCSFLLVFM